MADEAPLHIEADTDGATATVRLAGELDVHTAPQLGEILTRAQEGGATEVVIDVAELRFCDSSGIQVLVQARERAINAGGVVRLAGVQGTVEKVLVVTGLLDLFQPTPSND
jgi:anti-anti-sigma factor